MSLERGLEEKRGKGSVMSQKTISISDGGIGLNSVYKRERELIK
jgi:hypothetical protein